MRVSFPFLSILAYPSMVVAQRLQKHSHAVWTDFSSSQPQAIAIVLGHLGVSDHTLHRYAKWYVNRSSSVVAASSPPHIFARNGSLRDTTEQILAQTVRALHQAESNSQAPRNLPPIVVHLFSNGGAFLLQDFEKLLLEKSNSDSERATRKRVRQQLALGYQIFDSCPCYLRVWGDNMYWKDSFPHPQLSRWVRMIYARMSMAFLSTWFRITTSFPIRTLPAAFWSAMKTSRACPYAIYVYSTRDLLSDASAVDRLIQYRRQQSGGKIRCDVHRYDDSNHCRIDKDHPKEYGQMIDKALEAAVQRATCSQLDHG